MLLSCISRNNITIDANVKNNKQKNIFNFQPCFVCLSQPLRVPKLWPPETQQIKCTKCGFHEQLVAFFRNLSGFIARVS